MKSTHYSLLGHYASLTHRLEKASGGTAALKEARAAAISALHSKQTALLAAHHKLMDALHEYETRATAAVSSVNRALCALRTSPQSAGDERLIEAAMHAGAHHLDHIHHEIGDGETGGGSATLPIVSISSAKRSMD